jgi:hypothetical protein
VGNRKNQRTEIEANWDGLKIQSSTAAHAVPSNCCYICSGWTNCVSFFLQNF